MTDTRRSHQKLAVTNRDLLEKIVTTLTSQSSDKATIEHQAATIAMLAAKCDRLERDLNVAMAMTGKLTIRLAARITSESAMRDRLLLEIDSHNETIKEMMNDKRANH